MHTGEAQKIDRIMERFAERYCKDNPHVFNTSDAAYLLSFALIMLNTDAHNPMADKKLTLDDFVSMCQYQVCLTTITTMTQAFFPDTVTADSCGLPPCRHTDCFPDTATKKNVSKVSKEVSVAKN